MAQTNVPIEIRDDLSAALDRAIAAAVDLTPAMMDIAGHLDDTTRDRFETERNPLGVPWKPSRRVLGLDGSKEGHGPFAKSGVTLTLSGDLRNSIRANWGKDFAEAGPEASGGAAVYAKIHQFGGKITPKSRPALTFGGRSFASVTIPARAYLGFNDENADYALDTLKAFLARALAPAGNAA